MSRKTLWLNLALAAALGVHVGCQDNDDVGDDLQDAGEAVGEAAEDAGEAVGDAAEDAADAVEDATN